MSHTLPIPDRSNGQGVAYRPQEPEADGPAGEQLDEAAIAQVRQFFEVLDRWEREAQEGTAIGEAKGGTR